jgi:Flp pilus assembly pilin Flp
MKSYFKARAHAISRGDGRGVTSIEYGLIATAVALLVAAGVFGLGPRILLLFQSI